MTAYLILLGIWLILAAYCGGRVRGRGDRQWDGGAVNDQEAHDCDHDWQPARDVNVYRCTKGCDYFLRSLKTLAEVRAIQQRKRAVVSAATTA